MRLGRLRRSCLVVAAAIMVAAMGWVTLGGMFNAVQPASAAPVDCQTTVFHDRDSPSISSASATIMTIRNPTSRVESWDVTVSPGYALTSVTVKLNGSPDVFSTSGSGLAPPGSFISEITVVACPDASATTTTVVTTPPTSVQIEDPGLPPIPITSGTLVTDTPDPPIAIPPRLTPLARTGFPYSTALALASSLVLVGLGINRVGKMGGRD